MRYRYPPPFVRWVGTILASTSSIKNVSVMPRCRSQQTEKKEKHKKIKKKKRIHEQSELALLIAKCSRPSVTHSQMTLLIMFWVLCSTSCSKQSEEGGGLACSSGWLTLRLYLVSCTRLRVRYGKVNGYGYAFSHPDSQTWIKKTFLQFLPGWVDHCFNRYLALRRCCLTYR